MKRILQITGLLAFIATSFSVKAQNVLYRDTFIQNATYCPTGTYGYKWTNYKNFRAALDTGVKFFTEVRMWGQVAQSNSVSARTCTDLTVVRRLAQALKNGTGYVGICNGLKWEVSAAGSCNNGSCSAPTSEVVHFATYPSSASTGVCACGAQDYWVIRTTIQNVNKGGIMVGTTGTTCNPADQWIELEFKSIPPFNYDIATTQVLPLDQCGYTQNIDARFANLGKKAIDSFQYAVKVNTTTYGPFWAKAKLQPQKDTVLRVRNNHSFTANVFYNIHVFAWAPNNFKDSFPGDDTAKTTVDFKGGKPKPKGVDTSVCGSQSLTLRAVPNSPSDSLAWFANRSLSQFLGFGTKYTTKYLSSGATYRFYVASYNGFVKGVLNAGYTFTNSWPGTMFDITATNGDLFVDSMGLNLYSVGAPVGQNTPLEIYIREGGYLPGVTTPSMWTRIFNGNVLSRGSQQRTLCNVQFQMKNGVTYGVYLNFLGGAPQIPLVKPSATTISTADMRLQGGTLNQPNFGTYLNNYTFDGEIFYRRLLCTSTPDSSSVIVNPSPYGAKLAPGTPFQTSPKKSGNGVAASPHVVAMGDTLAFDLSAPTGYTNANHNTTWKVASVTMMSPSGRPLTTFTWSDPGTNPGRLAYTPDTTVIDSIVRVRVRLQQIGGSNCDTFLTHFIYVAPLPVPDFTRQSKICDGDLVEFTNKSKIKSGFLEYKWEFGDGDSSEATEPIKQYPNFGVYYCKMYAISSIYGYKRFKIDTITITQIPLISFKVLNACETGTHSFINNTTVNSGILSYSWDFGDGSAKNFQTSPTHKYALAGQYKVTLTATANGCTSTGTKNAYLFPKPKADFNFPSGSGIKYCTNTPVPFNNASTISSGNLGVKWTFEGGEFGTINNPTHVFTKPGSYNINLKAVSEFGCTDSIKKPLLIVEAPKVSFTNSPVCDLTPTKFTNNTPAVSGTVANTKWTFGDGATSTASSPTHQYTVLGPKTVKLVVSLDNSCSDSFSKQINVGTQADVQFEVENTCSGKEVQFENNTTFKQGNIAYKWLFGGVDSSTVADPKYTFNVTNSTTYNITLIATVDGACETMLTKSMTVYELPKCAFTVAGDWTPGDGWRTVKVTAGNTTYPFYRFKFSDGGSLQTSTGTYQFPFEGDFTVTMIARNQVDCECQSTQAVSIRNSLGTNEVNTSDIRLYPNPSTGIVNVQSAGNAAITSVEVFNLLGEQINVNRKINGTSGTIEFANSADGIYLVKVTTTAGTVTKRITIHK